ncbi:MAG TPA: hypothetical protein VLV50_12755 [Stellaceae bacterium]|nr:hypothetical protein [Stellaceae bacterium]
MTTHVHLVGSIGLDTVADVFTTCGGLLGPYLRRMPDGEPGGRRLWISWQFPVLRSNPYLEADASTHRGGGMGFHPIRLAPGVKAEDVRFGELGYAREARASYLDFVAARERGTLPKDVRFQVCLPTPFAVIAPFCADEAREAVLPAYERAMLAEVAAVCAAIPHKDLALQWDVCIEMVMWDGRWRNNPPFPGMDKVFASTFARLAAPVPDDVELGFHLCYGDLDAKHFIDPADATKMVELANLIGASVKHKVAWMHMPVPVARDDDAFFAPLRGLKLGSGTELYLGLVHAKDGVDGTMRRITAARKFAGPFGIASECGIARARTPDTVRKLIEVHAGAAKAAG